MTENEFVAGFLFSLLQGIVTGMAVMFAYFLLCQILKREFPSFRKR